MGSPGRARMEVRLYPADMPAALQRWGRCEGKGVRGMVVWEGMGEQGVGEDRWK